MTEAKQTGNRGEAIAKEYLKKSGYTIIAQNSRIQRLEIDIIAAQNNQLTFFEVKTRSQNDSDKVDIPLSRRQIKNLKRAITGYCIKKQARLDRARLDLIVISVDRATRLASLRHYRDIL